MPPKDKSSTASILVLSAALLLGCEPGSREGSDPSAKGPVAVLFEIDGEMPPFDTPSGFLGSQGMSQHRFEKLLDRATRDIQVQEIVLHFGTPQIGWGRAWDLSEAISRARASGKPMTCHIGAADNRTYWIAAAGCEKILVAPAGGVDLVGLSLEAVHMKEMLDSLGVEADMLHVGRYKDAAEPFTRDEMSPEAMEAAQAILDSLDEAFVSRIATARGLDLARAREVVSSGPYSAKEAVELGLADEVRTLGSLADELEERHAGGLVDDYGKEPPKPISFTEILDLLGGAPPDTGKAKGPKIALVPVVGPIVSGTGGDDLMSGMDVVSDGDLVATLGEAARDDSIKAVVLRIDSPGGSVLASDNIWEAVRRLEKRKPVVASMGDVAASGGYYVAAGAREIFATPGTLTGSIGVVGGKVVIGKTLEKLGIHAQTLQTSSRASMGSPLRPFTEEERGVMTGFMKEAYDLFIDRIAEGRSMDAEKIRPLAEGRVWTGEQALASGLVDRRGTLNDAVERARELAGAAGVPVEVYPKPKTFMELISEQLAQQPSALAFARRHPFGRRALAMASLLSRDSVIAFAPTAYEVR